MPKIVSPESRRAEIRALETNLYHASRTPVGERTEQDWRNIAKICGKLQRKSRQLGGLGRGG